MQRKIRKAKLKSRSLEVELIETVETENGPISNEVIIKSSGLVHEDLINTFNKLALHMIVICDMKKSELINEENIDEFDMSLISDYQVKGFSLGGDDENEGASIIGARKFSSGKVLNIVTPFTKFNDGNDPYMFNGDFYNDIDAAIYQVDQYLDGKYAIKQLELPFDEVEVLEAQETDAA